ncbi:MAG TPA: hypothetical protein PLR06_03640 [Cyclobacteriaceae bacterium]|nr:hypothetical protein [Cyclobacteriaceae bacterium]
MPDKEYYIILPLLLYGLAIADLVSSWRALLKKERRYIPYIITSLLLLEVSFWNFYQLNHWMTDAAFGTYLSYFKTLLQPLTFLLVVAVFTPEEQVEDIKVYYTKNIPIIFGGLAIFVALHFLFEIEQNVIPRLAAIALLIVVAVTRQLWPIYILLLIRVYSWFM